jgi:hypothetical protein
MIDAPDVRNSWLELSDFGCVYSLKNVQQFLSLKKRIGRVIGRFEAKIQRNRRFTGLLRGVDGCLDTVGVWGSNPHAPTIPLKEFRRTVTFSVAPKRSTERATVVRLILAPASDLQRLVPRKRPFILTNSRFHSD